MTDQRKAFEAWIEKERPHSSLQYFPCTQIYADGLVEAMWIAGKPPFPPCRWRR